MMLTLGSLFDGLGGWQFAAVRNGVKPIWSSEIEKFCIALTKERFPDTIQLGDITKIDGAKIQPVDIICMGSPCQDLSVAGKREGLKGERSGLFRTAIDVVRSMRDATNGLYPKVVIWENVPGAFTSNEGMDFRAVLEEFTECEIPMPKSERWASARMVRSRRCDVAWRCFDAQYWGVPQRRNRIFLVADFREAGRCAAEILFKCESLQVDTPQSKGKGKEVAGCVTDYIETVYEEHEFGGWRECRKGATLRAGKCGIENIVSANTRPGVRRLTPRECERLQGLPDNYTLIDDKSCSDSARYKALGNGMAQPCADFVIRRIVEEVEGCDT